MNAAQFEQDLKERGFGEPQSKDYEPNFSTDMHTHEFTARVLVVGGEFTLVTEGGANIHQPGEVCELTAGTLHAEQTGAKGAKLLIGKK